MSSSSGTVDQFLNLIADPFQAEVQQSSIYAAIVWSFAVSGALFLAFCWLRPRHSIIYAPRARHADEKHAPPSLKRNTWSWVDAVKGVTEQELVEKIGLDAVIFLRFSRMIRDIFLVLTVLGCGILIPVTIVGGADFYEHWNNIATLMKFTPQYIFGRKFWAYVFWAYIMQGTVCFFVWRNYKVVYRLRRAYFNSHDYKSSLHSRTLLLTHIPKNFRTDSGIATLVDEAKQTQDVPRTAIARNVKDLPELIKAHDESVRKLEACLAKYLRNPERLPAKRPTCKVFKEDRAIRGTQPVDAIDYLTDRISRLEADIKETRESIDKRDPLSYGFASYPHIEDAHAVAYASRKKGPAGCDVWLAPKPHDLLWQNLPMSRATRGRRIFWDGMWMVLFTLVFVVPNMLTSVFLSDFSHLGLVWPSFQSNLSAHPTGWGMAQGIVAPLFQTLMYMFVPIVFRRLYTHSGDISKTKRERHVCSRLYAFFVFNNLIVFSVFGSAWRFVAAVIAAQNQGVWDAIRSAHLFSSIMKGLINVSTFWLTWQMQRNLSAAIDISQAWPLVWNFVQRKLLSPTPRQLIELTAPQPFEYADYYNNCLFVATVGLVFGTLQPIILPVTAFYIAIELWFKKYLLQYVLFTKTESGGQYWRFLINRLLVSIVLANGVVALVVGAQGIGAIASVENGSMLYAMVPLPFLLAAFKWYCKRTFDTKLLYYSTEPYMDVEGTDGILGPKLKRNDRVAVRFGHPALYKRLLTPMVHAKSRHLLSDIYGHRSNADGNIFDAPHRRSTDRAMPTTPLAYSDVYMAEMNPHEIGAASEAQTMPHVELVAEQDLDFENFKKRAEFRDEFGGDGELYGRPDDLVSTTPGTPSTFATVSDGEFFTDAGKGSRASTRHSSWTRVPDEIRVDVQMAQEEGDTTYEHCYQRTPRSDGFTPVDIGPTVTPFQVFQALQTEHVHKQGRRQAQENDQCELDGNLAPLNETMPGERHEFDEGIGQSRERILGEETGYYNPKRYRPN